MLLPLRLDRRMDHNGLSFVHYVSWFTAANETLCVCFSVLISSAPCSRLSDQPSPKFPQCGDKPQDCNIAFCTFM